MNEGFKAHWHTKAIQCHIILPKRGPLSLLKNNDKTTIIIGRTKKRIEGKSRAFKPLYLTAF